ncbi:cyclophilin peptidyl-prolyl cis-trans isomerase Cyp8 [Coemansia sp. RSA 2673]|nr:cyclophilin peptidyl-prolyl cis-trans isomerase Cyp8 [Coemansia sp. RSA 2673]
MAPVTQNEAELVNDEEYMFARIKAKGYAQLVTNLGNINLELHCDKAPRTCYNFFKLARAGYYDGTHFHRSIKNFMIQGGDPTGTGRGGKSFWGADFKDELAAKQSLSERGVLAMANRGPNTNSSQFFILYRAAKHLDGKHTVFGRVVGGLPVLSKMESVPTDDSDRPTQNIVIKNVAVFVDPYVEFSNRLERKLEHEKERDALSSGKRQRTEAEEEQLERETTTWFGTRVAGSAKGATGSNDGSLHGDRPVRAIGKYMKKPLFDGPAREASGTSTTGKAKERAHAFGDFGSW